MSVDVAQRSALGSQGGGQERRQQGGQPEVAKQYGD
jgi:hypothetical protein